MSKQTGRVLRKVIEKVDHSSKLKTYIAAGSAVAGPPLGPMLGQRGVNIAAFCKDFNERTKDIKQGIPLPCRITANADRTYQLVIHSPPSVFLLKQAAGIQRGAMTPGNEISGKITRKHVYEIAKIKIQDPVNALLTMQNMCDMIVGAARTCGIEIVDHLDPVEYQKYLEERKIVVEEQRQKLQEAREAKMLRTG